MKTSFYALLVIVFCNYSYAQITDFDIINFKRADAIAKSNEGYLLDNLPLLAHKLTYKLPTQVEKFRAIYMWVCHNIKGDIVQHNKVDRKRRKLKNDSVSLMKWNTEYKRIAFKKLLKHKKTMCTGYAYLIKELCYLANIECVIVDGYGRSVSSNVKELEMANHSWNAVELNNKWYLCDATWSSGYMAEYTIFIQDYNNGYFLTEPILFGKNHFPLKQKWLLNKNVTASSFVSAPIVYGETFEQKITPITPQNMCISLPKNNEIEFSFKTPKSILNKNIALVYYVGIQEKTLKIDSIKNIDGTISFNYKFKHKGTYDTHLKINGNIVATYTIKVTKK